MRTYCDDLAHPRRDAADFQVSLLCVSKRLYVGYPHVHVKMKVMPSRIINVAAFLYNFKSNLGTAPSEGLTVQFNLGY